MSPRTLFSIALVLLGSVGPVASTPVTAAAPAILVHAGMANASAAVPVGDRWFATAGGDDNRIRIYANDSGGAPVATHSLGNAFKGFHRTGEFDLEGAARIGERVYWIGSHGRNKEGKERPERQRFIATRIVVEQERFTVETLGQPCTTLLDTLVADPRYVALGFPDAAGRPPESDGINIEGIAATPEGGILIGFRSPVPKGKTVLAPLQNPAEVIEGKAPRFGDPILLDLGGRGIRDMALAGNRWFLIGGSEGSGGTSLLYRWNGVGTEPELVSAPGIKKLNPEGIAVFGGGKKPHLLVVSDDGHHQKPGATPTFRSVWVKP